jgi:hypothetical protein
MNRCNKLEFCPCNNPAMFYKPFTAVKFVSDNKAGVFVAARFLCPVL